MDITKPALIEEQVGQALKLCGRFDAFEVADFELAVEHLQTNPDRRSSDRPDGDIVVDLWDVDFIDSAALAALVKTMKRQRQAGSDLILRNPSDPVRVILELTKLDAAFTIQSR